MFAKVSCYWSRFWNYELSSRTVLILGLLFFSAVFAFVLWLLGGVHSIHDLWKIPFALFIVVVVRIS